MNKVVSKPTISPKANIKNFLRDENFLKRDYSPTSYSLSSSMSGSVSRSVSRSMDMGGGSDSEKSPRIPQTLGEILLDKWVTTVGG